MTSPPTHSNDRSVSLSRTTLWTRAVASSFIMLCASWTLGACASDDAQGTQQWDTKDDLGEGSFEEDMSADAGEGAEEMGDGAVDMSPDARDAGGDPDRAPSYPAAVETQVSTLALASGELLEGSCVLLDQYGEPVLEEATLMDAGLRIKATPEDVLRKVGGSNDFEAIMVGTSRVSCSSRSLGLTDTTPEEVVVSPGAPHRTALTLSERTMSAGSTATATCEVFDIHGNLVPDAQTVISTDVMGDGIDIAQVDVTITRAGDYVVTCSAGAAPQLDTASLEVTPSLPASLTIEKNPLQQVYGIGQVIAIETYVADIYGNVITDAPVDFVSAPEGTTFGDGRFRYFDEGTYDVTATVTGQTQGDVALMASTQIVVNGVGPEINCDGPTDGAQLLMAPGATVTFKGSLADTNGVDSVMVNGAPAMIAPDGSFEAIITTRYGINFVDVTARDDFGVENSRTCAFQVSDNWTAPGEIEQDALMLKLRQPAVDDYMRGGPLSSLGDILFTVLNSPGLIDTLDDALIASGPVENGNTTKLLDDSCATRIIFCIRARVWYQHDSLNAVGPHTTSLTLLQDGLNLMARIHTIKLTVRVRAIGIIDTTGEVEIEFIDVDLDSNLLYENGRPRVTLRQLNNATIGDVDTSFNGIDGWIVNLLVGLFQGTVGNLLQDQIEGFINNEFNAVLDGLVQSLDVNSLGTTIDIPKLDQSGDIALQFNAGFSSLTATPARALFGLGAGFDGPVLKGINSRGAAIPAGPTYLDPPTMKSVAASIHVSIINQVLHALWRAGFFDGTIGAQTLGDSVPAGTLVELDTNMPPMLVMRGGTKADLHIGSMSLGVVYPGVFDEPLYVTLGATARTSIGLVGDSLEFTDILLDEFYFSAPGVSLDETTRDLLETFLKNLVQKIVDSSLNDALPALPIPSFTLPASLSTYGLPANAELGVYNPSLDADNPHFILDGEFGIR